MILIQILEVASLIMGTGTIGFKLGKSRGQAKPTQSSKSESNFKELEEVERFLDPFKNDEKTSTSKKTKSLPRFKWDWEKWDKKNDKGGFRCPKCRYGTEIDRENHPAYCECELPSHFHFTCKVCKVKAMINTADHKNETSKI